METLGEIEKSKNKMVESLNYNLFYTFMIQFLVSITLVLIANPLFKLLHINYLIRDIFKITTIGAFFNISAFILILVLLYFEKRKNAFFVALSFFLSNTLLTLYFRTKPLKYTGYGFTIASGFTFILAIILFRSYLQNINYETFALQPIYIKERKDIFVKIADKLNNRYDNKHKSIKTKLY